MHCESCGFPMRQPEDHGGGDITCPYCKYCAPKGKLRSRAEIRKGWIRAVMQMENLTLEEATQKIDEAMPKMPAWRKQ